MSKAFKISIGLLLGSALLISFIVTMKAEKHGFSEVAQEDLPLSGKWVFVFSGGREDLNRESKSKIIRIERQSMIDENNRHFGFIISSKRGGSLQFFEFGCDPLFKGDLTKDGNEIRQGAWVGYAAGGGQGPIPLLKFFTAKRIK
jgi:hypothetical protein